MAAERGRARVEGIRGAQLRPSGLGVLMGSQGGGARNRSPQCARLAPLDTYFMSALPPVRLRAEGTKRDRAGRPLRTSPTHTLSPIKYIL